MCQFDLAIKTKQSGLGPFAAYGFGFAPFFGALFDWPRGLIFSE